MINKMSNKTIVCNKMINYNTKMINQSQRSFKIIKIINKYR